MNIKPSINKMFRLLFFRVSREEMLSFNSTDLVIGIICTWLVGMGRYWDDPGAKLLQYFGIGSVMYIFSLSLFIWLLLKPFYITGWSYKNLLTFVSFTAFPAIFYAIPVERFFDIDTAGTINVYFLLAVAVWRVALLIFYLRRFACLTRVQTTIATLLPLTIIVTILTVLNLERAIFNIMGGIREKTSNDGAYGILFLLTTLSILLIMPIILGYVAIIHLKYKERRTKEGEVLNG